MKTDISDFQLVLLPTRLQAGTEYSSLYMSVFGVMKDVWAKALAEAESPQLWKGDAVLRGEYLSAILYKDQIVGCYVATLYSLLPAWTQEHSYFSIFSPESIEKLQQRGVRNALTWEYLAVPEKWRKNQMDISVSATMIGLGIPMMHEMKCDTLLGLARIVNKVNDLLYAFGGETLIPETGRGNIICDLISIHKDKAVLHPDPRVNQLVDHLWQNRTVVDRFGNSTQPGVLRPAYQAA